MTFKVAEAKFDALQDEFERLEGMKQGKLDAHATAVMSFNDSMGRFDAVFGKIEILEDMATRFVSESPGESPFKKDIGETVDDVMTIVTGALSISAAFGSIVALVLSTNTGVRNFPVLAQRLGVINEGGERVLTAGKRLRSLGFAVVGAAIAGLSIYNIVKSRNEEIAFYRTNIPKYEKWHSDTDAAIAKLNSNRDNLEAELLNIQTQFGYNSYPEMLRELSREIGRVAEYEAMYVTAQKMFCQTSLPVEQIENFTKLPRPLLDRMESEIRPGGVPDGEFCEQFEVAS